MATTPWAGRQYVLEDPDSPAVYVSWDDAQAFIAVMQKLGIQQEGRTRETFWWRDHWADELLYSILEREFLAG